MTIYEALEKEYRITVPQGVRITSWNPPIQSMNNAPGMGDIELILNHPIFGSLTLSPTRMTPEVVQAISDHAKAQK